MNTRVTLEVSLSTLRALLDYQAEQASSVPVAEIGELIYDSQPLSPNRFVLASLGNVGNAWKAISVQLPGESDWTQALRLRHAANAHALRTARRKAESTAPPADQ